MQASDKQAINIKQLIEASSEPLIFNNHLQWELSNWSMDQWNQCLGDTQLQFRLGFKSFSARPQWEARCESLKGTFSDFLKFDNPEKWLYFDYKYLNQWFVDKFDLRNQIKWDIFGYSEVTADDSTIWIGSLGAHTPCHVDTYGANLIAQISGKKLWLLFPPETDLKPTRVPYEESTIYSNLNFYSPSEETISFLAETSTCKKVVLEPGQVLYVPNGWWHYVENLETAISINTWIPRPNDDNKRIDEAIILMITKLFANCLKQEEQQLLINNAQPIQQLSIGEVYKLLENSLKVQNSNRTRNVSNKANFTSDICSNLKELNCGIEFIDNLNSIQLRTFLISQGMKLPHTQIPNLDTESDSDYILNQTQKYLSILVSPDVVEVFKRRIQEVHGNETISAE